MHIHTHFVKVPLGIQNHLYSILCFGLFSLFVGLMLFVLWSLFGYQQVAYTYREKSTCVTSPKLLPQLFKSTGDADFRLDRSTSISVFGVPVYSHSFCVSPVEPPKAASAQPMRESLFGMPVLGKPIHVHTDSYAHISAVIPPDQAVPVDKPLRFTLDKPDETFAYTVQVDDKTSQCSHHNQELSCDLSKLGLEHAKTYKLQVVRSFRGKTVDQAFAQKTETLTPITITASSITGGSTVYDQPPQLTLETDKPIDAVGAFQLTAADSAGTETPLDAKVAAKDKTLTITFDKPLPRKQTITAQIRKLRAADGSGLSAPYTLNFTTSGGPAVKGVNIGKSAVAHDQTISLMFDQPLATSQNWPSLVSLTANGQSMNATIAAQGNKLVIDPVSNFPVCAALTIKLTADIKSPHEVSGDSAWSYTSRSRCAFIGSIGTSVGGRAITSYRFGSGANPVVYIGAIHGDEKSAKTLMDSWIAELEANADQIPAGRSIIVIPTTNPDGFAANSRLNKNSVDLNRNFPANDWKPGVTLPGGQYLTTGGGVASLSEPESQALAAFVQRERPRMLLTYHAKASIIEANEAGDSMAAAYLYAKTSRYRALSKSQNVSFQHDTTGALEDWMRDKLGLPALCIELASKTGNELSRNKDALWAMVRL